VRSGIRVLPHTRRRIGAELARCDVIHGAMLPPYAVAALTARRCLGVADLYDPGDLEMGSATGRAMRREASCHLAGRRLHLRFAHIVISANERQLERARGDLGRISRSDGGPALMVVPMGVPDPPPHSRDHPIRERIPAIGPTDPLILWWGTVWRWLDAGTAIEAVARLASRRPEVRLVFTAGRPADAGADRLNATAEARELARAAGLLDRNIFFLEEWIPYQDRHRYLRDADVGLTLHGETAEASMAARFRYMDYLWAELPCVLAAGDTSGEQLAAAGAARLVAPRDPSATAAALEDMLSDPAALAAARSSCRSLAELNRWSRVLEPLVARVEEMAPARRSPAQAVKVASEASRYYARRVVDRALAAFPG
jgi:glycosyltransferase involved in cell wall biosynthesis